MLLGGLELDLLCRQSLLLSSSANLFCCSLSCIGGVFRTKSLCLLFNGRSLDVYQFLLHLGHQLIVLLLLLLSFFSCQLALSCVFVIVSLFFSLVCFLGLLLHLLPPTLDCSGFCFCVGVILFLPFLVSYGSVLLKQTF